MYVPRAIQISQKVTKTYTKLTNIYN